MTNPKESGARTKVGPHNTINVAIEDLPEAGRRALKKELEEEEARVFTNNTHLGDIYISCVFLQSSSEAKQKKEESERGSIPWNTAGVQCFLQAFQHKGDHRQGTLSCLQERRDVLNRRQAHVDQDTGYPYELPRQSPHLDGSITGNPMHPRVGFAQFHR
jgi:hypothetical protein